MEFAIVLTLVITTDASFLTIIVVWNNDLCC